MAPSWPKWTPKINSKLMLRFLPFWGPFWTPKVPNILKTTLQKSTRFLLTFCLHFRPLFETRFSPKIPKTPLPNPAFRMRHPWKIDPPVRNGPFRKSCKKSEEKRTLFRTPFQPPFSSKNENSLPKKNFKKSSK